MIYFVAQLNYHIILLCSIILFNNTDTAFSKVTTDSSRDYSALLEPWPANSFECSDQVKVERDFIEYDLQIQNIPLNLELTKIVNSLREVGFRNIIRSTKYDPITDQKIPISKLDVHARDFLVLKKVLTDGIYLNFDQSEHKVEPVKELVRMCKNCCEFDKDVQDVVQPITYLSTVKIRVY